MVLKPFMAWVTALIRKFSSLSLRLLLFNLLLVFLPIAAILYLDVYENQLLMTLENSMVQQGRILSSALSNREGDLKENANALLLNLKRETETRLRILDKKGILLADSSREIKGEKIKEPEIQPVPVSRSQYAMNRLEEKKKVTPPQERWIYSLALLPVRLYRYFKAPTPTYHTDIYYPSDKPLLGIEVQRALNGQYGATTRISTKQRSVTLYSAIPIWKGDTVLGVTLCSQSTYRLLQDLYELRLTIIRIFAISVLVALSISLFSYITISHPLKRLAREARRIVPGRGTLLGRFTPFPIHDEIGELSRVLEDFRSRMEGHVQFLEAFGGDISHEFKNPIAAIRSSLELLQDAPREQRLQLEGIIKRNLDRLQKLTDALREYSIIDKELETSRREKVNITSLIQETWESVIVKRDDCKLEFQPPKSPIYFWGHEELLHRVFSNIISNAVSFSPQNAKITLQLEKNNKDIIIRVTDQGPGVPKSEQKKIFERFYSVRKDSGKGHTGLGLNMAKNIIEAYGGNIVCEKRKGGASFLIHLPL